MSLLLILSEGTVTDKDGNLESQEMVHGWYFDVCFYTSGGTWGPGVETTKEHEGTKTDAPRSE